MNFGKISKFWMPLIGILFCISESKAENGFAFSKIIALGIGWTHEMTCIQSYTAHRLDWVFSHGSNSSGIENPTVDNNIIESMQYYSIDGRILSEPPCKGLYIIRCVNKDGVVTSLKKVK